MAQKILIDIEISIPQDNFLKLKELGEQLNISVPEAIEMCLFEKCDEYLDVFKNNTPSKLKKRKK